MVLTQGLLFIIANGLYLLFSIFVGMGIYFLLRKRDWKVTISLLFFIIILFLPFYDLLIQKGIKTYYQTFKMNDTIYAYPEKDADGKIESLGTVEADWYSNANFIYKNSYQDMLEVFSYVSVFSEVSIILDSDNDTGKYIGKYGEKLVRINLKDKSYIDISFKDLKARYIVSSGEFKAMFFGLYNKKSFLFNDNKKNKILAKAWRIEFPKTKNKFRYKVLFWRSANGVPMGIDFTSNDKTISEQLFGFDYRINVSKLRK